MAKAIGKSAERSEIWWSNEGEARKIDSNWIDSSLRAGKPVVINGAIQPDDVDVIFNHYLVVTGKTEQGEYLANDSWTGLQRRMTDEQLAMFLRDNSIHDGAAIQVG